MIKVTDVDFNDYLNGFVVTLCDGRTVQVQFEKETNRLHADYGSYYPIIDKQNDYGCDLTDEEENQFAKWMFSNKEIQDYIKELDNN